MPASIVALNLMGTKLILRKYVVLWKMVIFKAKGAVNSTCPGGESQGVQKASRQNPGRETARTLELRRVKVISRGRFSANVRCWRQQPR